MSKFTDYKVLVFDVYGTLVDWEEGLYNALRPLLDRYPASASWGRREALQTFSSVEMDLQAQHPEMLYFDLLANAHRAIEKRLRALSEINNAQETNSIAGLNDPHTIFARSIRDWKAFPDSSKALHALAQRFDLVVLSNVDHDSFKYAHARLSEGNDVELTRKKLDLYSYPENNPNNHWFPRSAPDDNKSPFTLVLTAQDVKAYKPSTVGMQAVLRCVSSDPRLLGEEGKSPNEVKEKVLVVAQSLLHDHEIAGELGMRSVWIDRQDAVTCKDIPEGTLQKWTWRFETLAQLVDAVEEEVR
ncbi:hypothetical protein APHAL10511_006724 [Amanita phalloides]|nr:hypothetical protein APHAL10511_006724 [Amanita phalloides]